MAKKIKPINEEELKIPAYMRKKAITSQSRQQLILTALDRKEAKLKPNSKVSTARKRVSQTPRTIQRASTSTPAQAPKTTEVELPIKPKKLMQVGHTTHYMEKIDVAIILLDKRGVRKGDILLIEGDNFVATQPIDEMQIDRKPVARAKKGSHIGLKVKFPAKVNGRVYKL